MLNWAANMHKWNVSLGLWLCLAIASAAPAAAGDARLADAVMRKDPSAIRTLLQQKADVNGSQPDGMTALHWAVRLDDLETAKALIKAGAAVHAPTRYGITPMYLASLNGSAAMIDVLLAAGVDADLANPGGETALMTAARTGKTEAVKLLLDRGAAVNAKEGVRGQTALMWAVQENHPAVASLLLARGADINAQTAVVIPDGTTGAPQGTSGDIGAHGPGIYRSRAVPTPSGGMTALLFAARDGNKEMVRLLLDAGADINLPAANGTPPITVAITNNHIALAMTLLDRGADPNLADNFYKRTPLYAAIEMRNMDFTRESPPPVADTADPMDLIEALLAKGAKPNVQVNTTPVRGFMQGSANWANFDGQTPFIRAALAGDVTLMRLLLDNGADPKITTNDGATALMAAAGVNWVVSQTYSRSEQEYLEAAKLCLEKGNDIHATNSQGFTAMHGAANRGFDAMIRLLAENGARLDDKDKQGRTPMTFAEGVFLAVHPPVRKQSTITLLEELMAKSLAGAGKP
jgi:ankyrin repeat protein